MNISNDLGVITVLLERFEKQRLPRVLGIKAKVDDLQCLEEIDIKFLKGLIIDAQNNMPVFQRHPEFKELIGKITFLYHEITEKALNNQMIKAGR
ncbi:MAG: hypothetical protein Q7U98_16900 [Methylicorpusculum sp.]|uniref:hypothetical protein n=1 Tax=Methylicorpusculum sp. TaxID=2713644 RepID=UPI0027251323|nr:hypothetical protein [Methylicorpusculum sp.]MDO8842885.1 hypothetical protein [Methylicorpusculum sp.]MDO8940835.1 hypothetical protein [Methylicorpusculum sp.]MDP2179555.1 hypothetical protein [Methylicorpusculum sp.]MDP2204401.1 hypothetical protein [Methylicorpusculum sp.]MDP3527678.1 hypothetical protein [Methylicorpusculum sp.]